MTAQAGSAAQTGSTALASVSGSTLISDDGVGPISTKTNPKADMKALFPGVDMQHREAEDFSMDTYTVFDGSHRSLVGIADDEGKSFFKITVYSPSYSTAEGVSTSSTVSDLVEKYPDLTCKYETYDPNPENFTEALFCETHRYKHVSFHLDAGKWHGKPGKVAPHKLASRTLSSILWVPKPSN